MAGAELERLKVIFKEELQRVATDFFAELCRNKGLAEADAERLAELLNGDSIKFEFRVETPAPLT